MRKLTFGSSACSDALYASACFTVVIGGDRFGLTIGLDLNSFAV